MNNHQWTAWTAAAIVGVGLAGCAGRNPDPGARRGVTPDNSDTSPAKRSAPQPDSGEPRIGRVEPGQDERPAIMAANADRPRVEPVAPAKPVLVEDFRPAWWLDAPERTDGRIRVTAIGEDVGLVEARLNALEAAGLTLRTELGRAPEGVQTERYTVVQLPSGSYRAFVLMSGQE